MVRQVGVMEGRQGAQTPAKRAHVMVVGGEGWRRQVGMVVRQAPHHVHALLLDRLLSLVAVVLEPDLHLEISTVSNCISTQQNI